MITTILGALTALGTIAALLKIYIPKVTDAINNLAQSIHDHNAIERAKAAGQKANETGDTSDLEKPLHSGAS